MTMCSLCKHPFDLAQKLDLPEHQAGVFLAKQEYGDTGKVCADCLAIRGRLAMMYKTECFD